MQALTSPHGNWFAVLAVRLPPQDGVCRWTRRVVPIEAWAWNPSRNNLWPLIYSDSGAVELASGLLGVGLSGRDDPDLVNDAVGEWDPTHEEPPPRRKCRNTGKEELLKTAKELLDGRCWLDDGNIWGSCDCPDLSPQDRPCMTCGTLQNNQRREEEALRLLSRALKMRDVRK